MKRILWESYFDPSLSRKFGRRVRKDFPKEKLFEILNSLNVKYSFSEARYPRTPWKTEKKIEVEYEESKQELIKKIIEKSFNDSSGNLQ